jgi:hypothetical protein
MKKEKEQCKDCAEYGSEFCPECLEELAAQKTIIDNKSVDNSKK